MGTGRTLLLAVVCGVAVAGVYAAQPVLTPMGQDLGLAHGTTGWIVACCQLGYLVGLLLLVPLGDLRDRRRLIAVHLAVLAAGLGLTALATTAGLAFLGLAVAGAFAVVVQTTVAYAASVAPPEARGRTLGVVTSGVVIGILGARVLTGLLADARGWRSVYGVLALLSLALGALVLLLLPPDRRPAARGPRYREALASLGGFFTERLFLTRGLLTFFLFASFGTLWSGLSLPLSAPPFALSESRIGLFGLAGLAGALGAARAGRWADAGRAAPVIGGALAVLLASWAAVAGLPRSLWLLVLGIVALDFAVQAVHVGNQHLLTAAHPTRVSSVIGGHMVFYSLGSALGAATTTQVHARHGWAGCCLLGAGFAACALAVWALDQVLPTPPRRRRTPGAELSARDRRRHGADRREPRSRTP